ncbi:MAG TPA: Maf family protein [Candidatus Binatia bacterium]|nr:Maf family protein [Candidatus Binatia bacterium]
MDLTQDLAHGKVEQGEEVEAPLLVHRRRPVPVPRAPQARIVLASASPRRRELLTRAGIRFAVVEPPPDPSLPAGVCADLGCQITARQKAVAAAGQVTSGTFVVAGDTVVVGPRGALGKPGTPEVALRMLAQLRGSRHTVLTGVCVVVAGSETERLGVSRSLVRMRDFSDAELVAYVASGEPLDKAGAYAVQGLGGDLVEAVSGRVDTVIGLDVALVLRLLAEAGYPHPLPKATDVALQPTRRERRPLAPMRATQRA